MNEVSPGAIRKSLRAYYAIPFKVLSVFVRIYMVNQAWLAALLARRGAAYSFKGIIVITVLVWFGIWLFANEEHRNSLNQALGSFWADIGK
ncbi:MAG: hypothetical protein O7B79_14010 [SAR324 cluster bacterium]|nr:hypothetical protein [SAR324 cluster bacterium]